MRTGLPAFIVTDTAFFRNPNYHLPSDTIDTLDFTFMAQLVKSLELALLEFPTVSRPLRVVVANDSQDGAEREYP